MINYVALLRGINVGGHRIIKMEELRGMFEGMGLKEVRTYIQSGNVLFQSAEKSETKLVKKIEKHLAAELGYEIKVFLRTNAELLKITQTDPFKKKFKGKTTEYVAFLADESDTATKKKLEGMDTNDEMLRIAGREVYYQRPMIPDERPKFSNNLIDKVLGQPATMRNWATVNKLLNLAAK